MYVHRSILGTGIQPRNLFLLFPALLNIKFSDLVTSESKAFFKRFSINSDFLAKCPSLWNDDENYLRALNDLKDLAVVNDVATHDQENVCPNCGEQERFCGCDKDLPPVVGLNPNVTDMPPSAHQVNWYDPDRYSLPPVDRSEYDFKRECDFKPKPDTSGESSASRTSSRPHKLRKDPADKRQPTTRWTEGVLVKSPRVECWCRDCPWLLAYGILIVVWSVLVGICFYQHDFNYNAAPSPADYSGRSADGMAAECLSTCSRLTPPPRLTPPEKAVFHCTLYNSRWEGADQTTYKNPNCVEDCKSFGNVEEFVRACAVRFDFSGDEYVDRMSIFGRDSNVIRVFEDGRLDWHWIAHIMVITNTISLFFLLVPLFFCCLQIVIFSLTSIVVCVALTSLLWYYVYAIIRRLKEEKKFIPSNHFFITQTVFAALATFLTVYVIVVALIVLTKRLRVSCEVARFTSKFVNSVPTILLEALLTLILLLLCAVALLFASIGVERGGSFGFDFSMQAKRTLPVWAIWAVRILTGIVAFWTAQFIINCQTIIIHGAMARFYFDKQSTDRVIHSHKRLLKYHLCTACFAGILFNWLYWLRWVYPKSIIRSRSLFGTATYGLTFIGAGKEVLHLLHPPEGSRLRAISKVNQFYFLMHIQLFVIMCIVTHLVFFGWTATVYIELILVFYAYFVGLATVNVYRVTKDSIFLCYELDRSLTSQNPDRIMKMTDEDPYIFARQNTSRVNPR